MDLKNIVDITILGATIVSSSCVVGYVCLTSHLALANLGSPNSMRRRLIRDGVSEEELPLPPSLSRQFRSVLTLRVLDSYYNHEASEIDYYKHLVQALS